MVVKNDIQRQKENLMLELQQERALRYDAEKKLEEMRSECDSCRSKVAKLQDDFKKMEDIVRGMLAYKARFDQMKTDKIGAIQTYEISRITLGLMSSEISFEAKIIEYEMFIETLQKENVLLAEEFKALEATNKSREEMQEKGISQMLLQRVRFLEEQNTTLIMENTHQRHQYEQCLDDVANQVVQALLAQKTLREECGLLKERVSDLEQQNRSLSTIFLHRMNDRSQSALSNAESKSVTFSPAQQTNCSFGRYSFPGANMGKACMNERIDSQQRQSDLSSESLASMCSDYSVMSSSSSTNALRNHPGHQQPYSPPAWFHEVDMWPDSHRTPSEYSSSFHGHQGCSSSRNKQYNPNVYSSDDKFSQVKETYQRQHIRARDNKQGHINNLNHLQSPNQNVFETVVRRHHPNSDNEYVNERPNSSSSLHTNVDSPHPYKNFTPASECNQSPSEFFDSGLDAVETPNDEILAVDNLELSLPDQKIFKDKEVTMSANGDNISEKSVLLNFSNGLQRPTSLNLVAEKRDEELSEFECLKCKNHEPNNDGNVYVEPNKTIAQVLNISQVNTSRQFNHSSNQNNFNKNQFINTATTSTPIIHNIHVLANSSTSYFNNTSAECNESIGKDEGYSTMSSDVQGELVVRSTETAQECNDCDKQTYSSGIERKAKSFHDFINKEEMKEICEEDELEDNCTNFARELASSIVKQTDDHNSVPSKLDPKSTMDLLTARSSKLINLFSPQGFKNKNETSPSDALSTGEEIFQNSIRNNDSTAISFLESAEKKNTNSQTQVSQATSTPHNSLERRKVKPQKYLKNYTKSDFKDPSSVLFRTNSDSKIFMSQKVFPPNISENVSNQKLPLFAMTCSVDEVLDSDHPILTTSIKRSQCQVLNRIQSDTSSLASKENEYNSKVFSASFSNGISQNENKPDVSKLVIYSELFDGAESINPSLYRRDVLSDSTKQMRASSKDIGLIFSKASKWIWEWEPLNSSEESSDLNGTDSGFFITSLPPLPKIQEDFKISSIQNNNCLNDLSDASTSNINLLIGSSPELSRRSNSPDEKFKTSSLQRPKKKKIASVSPYKFCLNDSRTDMNSTPRLSWCSEELNLTGNMPPCNSLVDKSSIKSNSNRLSTGSYNFDISQEIPDVTSDKSEIELEDPSTIASALDLETKFTTDFYRLCPADSNRSLTKSRSNIDDNAESKPKDGVKIPQASKNHSVDLYKSVAIVALKKQMLNNENPKKLNEKCKTRSTNKVDSDIEEKLSTAQKESLTSPETKVRLNKKEQTPSISNPSSPSKKSPIKSPSKRNNVSAIPVMKKSPPSEPKVSNDPSMGVRRKIPKPAPKVKEQKIVSPKKEPLQGSPVKSDDNKKWRKESKIPTRETGKVKPQVNQVLKVAMHQNVLIPIKNNVSSRKSTSEQIEELNKMLSICGDSEEVLVDVKPKIPFKPRRASIKSKRNRRKKEGCETSWVHVEADVDLSDPKARANLLDSMLASSSSSSSSDDSSDECTIADRQHLHALHRFRRRKKRADFDKDQVVRIITPIRPSIMNCPEFFYRYGEKEQEAVSYFDFLDEMSTSTPSSGDFDEDHEKEVVTVSSNCCRQFYSSDSSSDTNSISISEDKFLSPIVEESYDMPETCRHGHANDFCLSLLHTSQEDEVNRISFSDSCAESFSSSDHSFTNIE
ncbi:Nck-associated protein 5 [Nymphon striatum]|nr:Nck-associated protein 5 [Nymphon striatum]